jgi:hypothetical protein
MQSQKIPSQPIPSQPIHQLFHALVDYHKAQGTCPQNDIVHLRNIISRRTIVRGSMLVSEMLPKLPIIREVPVYTSLCDHIEAIATSKPPKLTAPQLRQLYIYNKIDAFMQDIEVPLAIEAGTVKLDATVTPDALEKKKTAAMRKLLGLLQHIV